MKTSIKFTDKQLKSMYEFLYDKNNTLDKTKKEVEFFYNPHTPLDIYIKYLSYGIGIDNSIECEITILCINQKGEKNDCMEQFENLQQQMQFSSDFIKIDLDKNGNLIFV